MLYTLFLLTLAIIVTAVPTKLEKCIKQVTNDSLVALEPTDAMVTQTILGVVTVDVDNTLAALWQSSSFITPNVQNSNLIASIFKYNNVTHAIDKIGKPILMILLNPIVDSQVISNWAGSEPPSVLASWPSGKTQPGILSWVSVATPALGTDSIFYTSFNKTSNSLANVSSKFDLFVNDFSPFTNDTSIADVKVIGLERETYTVALSYQWYSGSEYKGYNLTVGDFDETLPQLSETLSLNDTVQNIVSLTGGYFAVMVHGDNEWRVRWYDSTLMKVMNVSTFHCLDANIESLQNGKLLGLYCNDSNGPSVTLYDNMGRKQKTLPIVHSGNIYSLAQGFIIVAPPLSLDQVSNHVYYYNIAGDLVGRWYVPNQPYESLYNAEDLFSVTKDSLSINAVIFDVYRC